MQRNSDLARDKAGADVPDMGPMPDPGVKQTEHAQTGGPHTPKPVTGIGKGKPPKGGKPPESGDSTEETAKEEAAARLTANFPQMDIPGMLEMPPGDVIVAMRDTFDRLDSREVTAEVRKQVRSLLLAMAGDLASEDPEMIINLIPADGDPLACLRCGANYSKNEHRYNKKGREQLYFCKGEDRHWFTFNPGFERRRYPNAVIAEAVRQYFKMGSASDAADEVRNGGKGPCTSTVSGRVKATVERVVKFLKCVGMKSIGLVWSTSEMIEKARAGGDASPRCWTTPLGSASRNACRKPRTAKTRPPCLRTPRR